MPPLAQRNFDHVSAKEAYGTAARLVNTPLILSAIAHSTSPHAVPKQQLLVAENF
jgi:hypothetical protein